MTASKEKSHLPDPAPHLVTAPVTHDESQSLSH